jgi:hypothetical protein
MRKWFPILAVGLVLCAGCKLFGKRSAAAFDNAVVGLPPAAPQEKVETKSDSQKPSELIVTPENSLTGKVIRYNDAGPHIVVDFPLGRTPAADKRMFVYRRGLKVGEVRISTWQRENLVVADLTAGEAQEGDEVRSK